jgi:hypothetical protein
MSQQNAQTPSANTLHQRKYQRGVKCDLKEIKLQLAEKLPEIREMLNQLLSYIAAQQQQPSAPDGHNRVFKVSGR